MSRSGLPRHLQYEEGEDDPPEEEDTNDPTNPNFYKDAAKKAKFALTFVTLKVRPASACSLVRARILAGRMLQGKDLRKNDTEALAARWKSELRELGIKVRATQ